MRHGLAVQQAPSTAAALLGQFPRHETGALFAGAQLGADQDAVLDIIRASARDHREFQLILLNPRNHSTGDGKRSLPPVRS
jgi:hypothetical protein